MSDRISIPELQAMVKKANKIERRRNLVALLVVLALMAIGFVLGAVAASGGASQ